MEQLSVYCLKYGEGALPKSMVFQGRSSKERIPISFAIYLIRTKDKSILVDAGCDSMPDFQTNEFISPSLILKEIGLAPSDITDVVLTHSHIDHIEGIKYFANATVYITNAELENGRNYIPAEMKVISFDNALSLDENILIREIGGHSKGSAVLEVKCKDGIHVFCGDECYVNENVQRRIPTASSENAKKSRLFIEKYSDKGYKVHTCHDFSLKTQRII